MPKASDTSKKAKAEEEKNLEAVSDELTDDEDVEEEHPADLKAGTDSLENDNENLNDEKIDSDINSDEDEDLLEGIPEEELNATMNASLPKVRTRASKSKARKRSTDPNVTMLTGDPVRMYLKEIGKVPLLTAAEEIDLAMKIEAGVAATEELDKADEDSIELERREKRRLSHIEQVGLDAKQQLIEANLRLVVSIAKR